VTRGLAVLLGALALAAPPAPQTAGQRWHGHARDILARRQQPNRRSTGDIGRLDDAAFRIRAAEIAREIAADLADPSLRPGQKIPAVEGLRFIGPLAAGVSGALAGALATHEEGAPQRIAYFCQVTRALEAVAPRDPVVIRALADALMREAPRRKEAAHTCGCALQALAAAGPAAAPIAGPVLQQLAQYPFPTNPSGQLGRTIEALGVAGAMTSGLIARAMDERSGLTDRATQLRALGKAYPTLEPAARSQVLEAALTLLLHKQVEIRAAAAEALAPAGAPALDALAAALEDPHYFVRQAAARALAGLGPAAAPAQDRLLAALDPFLGTGAAAAEALVAIGPSALPAVEARLAAAPPHLRPLVAATARALRENNPALVPQALATAYRRGPQRDGYVYVEVLQPGDGRAFESWELRIRVRFSGAPYTASGPGIPRIEDSLVADGGPNAFFSALQGRRAGDRLRLYLSPELQPDPYRATTKKPSHPGWQPAIVSNGGVFDVEITHVCEPVVWRLFKGGGIVGPMEFELYCR
jgi:hypothetical protein